MGVLAEEAVRITADTKGFHSQVESGVMGSVKKIATGAAAALGGLAIGKALFIDPIKSAGDFQQTLNVLQATAQSGGVTLKDVQAKAIALGADLRLPATSANDAATAMLEMGKGGFTMKQSMEAAHGVLLLSAAAQIDNATAATLTADSLHAFGLRAKDAGTVVDDFAGAANASTASMSEVGLALQQSGQSFHGLGIPIGDATTAIAAMANAGIKGSDAGTSLKTMLQRLNPHTKQAKQAMQDMGVHTFDAAGKFIGMRGVIEQMGPKLRAMSQEQRQATLNTIFGSDASRAASIILGQTTEQWDKQHAAVTRAGQAQQLANAQSKGFNGAMAGLRSTIETIQLEIGLKMIPVLTVFIRMLAENLPAAVAIVTTVLGDVAKVLQDIGNFITENIGSWRQVAIAIGIGAAAFVVLTTAVKVYTIAQAALNAVMTANPIGLVIIAIAALVVGLTLLYQRSATARAIMDGAWAGIRAGAVAAFNYISQTIIPAAIAAWNRFGPQVVAVLQQAATAIRTVVQSIATIVSTIVDQIRAHWDAIWSVFGPLARAGLQVVKTYVQTELNVIADVIRLFSDLIHGRWGAAWGELKNIVRDILNGLVSMIGSVLRGLAGTAGALARMIGEAIGNGIKSAVSALSGLAGALWGAVSSALNQVVGQAFGLAASIGSAIKNGAISGIAGLGGMIKSAAEHEIKSGLSHLSPFSPVEEGGKRFIGQPIAKGAISGLVDGFDKLAPQAEAAVHKIAERLGAATKKELPAIQTAYKTWITAAQAAFDAQVDHATKTIDAGFTKAQARLDSWKAKLTPTEFKIAQAQAAAAVAKVEGDVSAAAAALASLPAKQAAAWSQLLAQQAANMAALRATLQSNTDDALLAGNTFNKGMAASATDPIATSLIAAQQAFNNTKSLFDQGLTDQATFIAAANALDDAKVAASADSNATTLLDQYNTWQTALAQQAQAGAAITTQQAADADAQAAAQAGFDNDTLNAKQALNDAQAAKDAFYLQQKADKERVAKDAEYQRLSDHLKSMHDRTLLHLQNVQHAWDLHYAELARMATASGNSIGEDLAAALRASIPTVGAAAAAVAAVIAAHLKVKSPTEKGPMSDLDSWWTRLAPTLLRGFDASGLSAKLGAAVTPDAGGIRAGLAGTAAGTPTGGYGMQRIEMLLERIEKHTQATAQKPDSSTDVNVVAVAGASASTYKARR
jgi:TP901 family phage tail tape measure protein